ncbi:MAG: helix-turn-helix domain-containing protein, partial [Oscillospiraceae bacterium]|nr:helix-turn-helix domain-containing protein [Oscillospiraceae bacterium]
GRKKLGVSFVNFNERLQEVKEKYSLTNAKIAAYSDVSEGAVRFWLNGEKVPNAESIIQLSKNLDLSTDYVLGIIDNPISLKKTIESAEPLNDDEKNLIDIYRSLDDDGKALVKAEAVRERRRAET